PAYAAALADERRRKGHAPFRITQDLRKRGFADDLIARVVAPMEAQDREAQAFDAARGKARSLSGLADETAFRRLVGYLARRGYPEGLARKVSREVVYADREARRTAER
ncbi:MAG: RecX family transcriptional regulator, partial [Actinobacteria bacterium]|nr:RecX family transcriptional regulator [Actinomycetota bacterium]